MRRRDFRAYITTRLAADFACALAKHLATGQAVSATEQPYNSGGIELTACQLHEALLLADSPELDVPFEDRGRVRIFQNEKGQSGPGLYCECVDVEEEGCILLDGTSHAVQQPAQAVDLDFDFAAEKVNEVIDAALSHGTRLIPVEAIEQMRAALLALIDGEAVGNG